MLFPQSDFIKEIRFALNDRERNGDGIRFTNERIVSSLNEGLVDFYGKVDFYNTIYLGIDKRNVSSMQMRLDRIELRDKTRKITQILFNNKIIPFISVYDINNGMPDWRSKTSNQPQYAVIGFNEVGTVELYPRYIKSDDNISDDYFGLIAEIDNPSNENYQFSSDYGVIDNLFDTKFCILYVERPIRYIWDDTLKRIVLKNSEGDFIDNNDRIIFQRNPNDVNSYRMWDEETNTWDDWVIHTPPAELPSFVASYYPQLNMDDNTYYAIIKYIIYSLLKDNKDESILQKSNIARAEYNEKTRMIMNDRSIATTDAVFRPRYNPIGG